jgi:hypothetical protein
MWAQGPNSQIGIRVLHTIFATVFITTRLEAISGG